MFKLFIGGFPRDLEEVELQEIVEAYGKVLAVKIVRDKRTGISRRFGFVEMASKEDAQRVIDALHEGSIDGEELGVKEVFETAKKTVSSKKLPGKGNRKNFRREG